MIDDQYQNEGEDDGVSKFDKPNEMSWKNRSIIAKTIHFLALKELMLNLGEHLRQ